MNYIEKKQNQTNNKERDPSIELLRIIGCLSVIGTHIKLKINKKKNLQIFQ
jgi:peptidoglycan/LPS O-acetylase OafA/YrhL